MNFRNKSKGAILVEFALVLPFLLLLTVGIIELSNAFMAFNNLNKSIRDGISYLSRHAINATNNGVVDFTDLTDTRVANEVASTKSLITANFNATTVALDQELQDDDITISNEGTTHIKITAAYSYNLFLGTLLNDLASFFDGGFATTIPLTASAVYRVI